MIKIGIMHFRLGFTHWYCNMLISVINIIDAAVFIATFSLVDLSGLFAPMLFGLTTKAMHNAMKYIDPVVQLPGLDVLKQFDNMNHGGESLLSEFNDPNKTAGGSSH